MISNWFSSFKCQNKKANSHFNFDEIGRKIAKRKRFYQLQTKPADSAGVCNIVAKCSYADDWLAACGAELLNLCRYFSPTNTQNRSDFKGWGDCSATTICIHAEIDWSTCFSMWVINEGRGWNVMINSIWGFLRLPARWRGACCGA